MSCMPFIGSSRHLIQSLATESVLPYVVHIHCAPSNLSQVETCNFYLSKKTMKSLMQVRLKEALPHTPQKKTGVLLSKVTSLESGTLGSFL